MSVTVIEHVLARLREIGITDVFGVPGDYAFPVNDESTRYVEGKSGAAALISQ